MPELTPIARPDVSVVAVAGARFAPRAKVDHLQRETLASAVEGAVTTGATTAALGGLSAAILTVATANPYGAALTLATVAIGGLADTVYGGISGASAAEQGRRMHDAASAAATAEQLLKLQRAFAEEVAATLGRKAGRPVPVVDIAPSSPEETADYRSLSAGAGAAVLEVALLDLEVLRQADRKLLPTLTEIFTPVITVRARLLRTADNAPLAELRYRHFLPPARAERWFADDGALFIERLRQAIADSADAVLVELLWLYRLPSDDGSEVPAYVLRPLDPPLDTRFAILGALRGAFMDSQRASAARLPFSYLSELQPTLRWQAFAQAANATYDLRIFEAVEREMFFVPARELYRREGLPHASHRLEQALQPCGRYFWTVRAVFRLANATRVTEWSGAYNVFDLQIDPSRWRRGEHRAPAMRQDRFFHPLPGMEPDWFYYPLRAPSAQGKHDCSD